MQALRSVLSESEETKFLGAEIRPTYFQRGAVTVDLTVTLGAESRVSFGATRP